MIGNANGPGGNLYLYFCSIQYTSRPAVTPTSSVFRVIAPSIMSNMTVSGVSDRAVIKVFKDSQEIIVWFDYVPSTIFQL